MAATLKKVSNGYTVAGSLAISIIDFTGDTSYPSGGYLISPAFVGVNKVLSCSVMPRDLASTVYNAVYDANTSKFVLVYPTGGTGTVPAALADPGLTEGAVTVAGAATGSIPAGATPVTSTSAQPSVSVPASGLTASIADSPLTAGRGKQLAAATDVSTLKYRLTFIGTL